MLFRSGTGSGADRYEVFVNAKEVRMEDGITEPDYFAMLAQKGAESLLPAIEYFEGSVLPEGNLIYKTDYDLGDTVTIENIKWNKRIDVQITEITEVYDEYGARTLIPIFGQATPTLADALSGSKDTSGSGGGGIAVTANRALVSDSTGNVSASSVTDTELGYLTGVTSNLQTQLNAKQATITGGASTIVSSNLTVNRALVSDASGKVAVSAVTSTELAYLDGVTSAIQTQLNGKAATAHTHAAADLPNNVVVLWDSTLSAAGTVTLSQAVTNFDFILVEAALDNASNENRVSGMYYSKNGLRSNVRAYTVDASISTGNLA